MTQYSDFYIEKSNHTFADELLMYGWSHIVTELLHHQHKEIPSLTIRNEGACYRIVCPLGIDDDALVGIPFISPLKMIRTPKNKTSIPIDMQGVEVFDYEAVKETNNFYYESLRLGVPEDQLPLKPHEWDHLRAINPASLHGYNNVVKNFWRIRAAQPQILKLLCQMFSNTPNDIDSAIKYWMILDEVNNWGIEPLTTCLQLFNPDHGAGQNRAKANGLTRGLLEGFWLLEWLKALGFFEAAITRLAKGTRNRKTFVVSPCQLAYEDHRSILSRFAENMTAQTSVRFDILAAIRYTYTLLEHLSQTPNGLAQLLVSGRVTKIVAGFQTAFYKDFGSGVAILNISFIALPCWVDIQSPEDIYVYMSLLEELVKLINQFDESHNDAFQMLQYFRDFVSGNDFNAFFRFTNAFPIYYMEMREHYKYAYALSTAFIERVMMSSEKRLSEILESEAFRNIAYAIRRSTIIAQYHKQVGNHIYNVRYGLGQELARTARYPKEFIVTLSNFLQMYNAENMQVADTHGKQLRGYIRTSDIDEIVRLIDAYGSEPVASLLVAYGYAIDHEDQPEQANTSEDTGS